MSLRLPFVACAAVLLAAVLSAADAPQPRVSSNDGNDANDGTQPDSPPLANELKPKKVASREKPLIELPNTEPALLENLVGVRVEILETPDRPDVASSRRSPGGDFHVEDTYIEPAMAFVAFPAKYDGKAQRADRSSPFFLRATSRINLPPGENKLLLRSFNASHLFLDGKEIASTPALVAGANGHNPVPADPQKLDANMRALRAGHAEKLVTIEGGNHTVVLVTQISGGKLRPEIGETSVSVAAPGKAFLLVSPTPSIPMTDSAWLSYADAQRAAHFTDDANRRRQADATELACWSTRHDLARSTAAKLPPLALNGIDAFINARLASEKIVPAPLVDDFAFVRRASLDLIGLIPNPAQLDQFVQDTSLDRRAKLIDRLLADPGWADNWVGYWQDVLAENPGILKPQLNNTGPFRTWIYESFLDNKPIDRFATELVMMEGSVYGGAPAGFAAATQNDAPMAEKASVIGKAFLAAEMKCARCHDAPHHKFAQKDLFASAAMLKRAPQDVPKTSSIPMSDKDLRKLEVNVTLKPGTSVQPEWPFEKLIPESGSIADLPAGILRQPNDFRERFAALITSPKNARFAKVIVNRLWKRYMGVGIVEPVDDWETARPSHPELLDYLARELMTHDYDLKHIARLILNSQAYQRAIPPGSDKAAEKSRALFAAQARRRMSAEQLADSLFAVAGKAFGSEELNLDVDSRENVDVFQNLGIPRRAWQFTSLSNERDRPALSLPVARTVIDMLVRFGWRESRQSPLSVRDDTPNVLQPAMLANGPAGNRIVRLSDDSELTRMCLTEQSPDLLLKRMYYRILSRPPSAVEMKTLLPLVAENFNSRLRPGDYFKENASANAVQVSWSNHLSPEATKIKMEMEKAARLGEPPTKRLDGDWRERMEDVIWSLVNSPEFVFIP